MSMDSSIEHGYKTQDREPEEFGAYERWGAHKLGIEDRAKILGQEKLLEELNEYMEKVREKLLDAFGSNPSPDQIEDAPNQIRNDLLFIAGVARSFAMHHDNYRVGSAMLALRRTEKPDENPWVLVFSANTKVDENGQRTEEAKKWCGEQYLMDYAAEPANRVYKIVSFTITGPVRSDDRSRLLGKHQITLTPCALCRDRMLTDPKLTEGDNPIISPEKTEIYTMDPDHEWRQKPQRAKDLHRFHGEHSAAHANLG